METADLSDFSFLFWRVLSTREIETGGLCVRGEVLGNVYHVHRGLAETNMRKKKIISPLLQRAVSSDIQRSILETAKNQVPRVKLYS